MKGVMTAWPPSVDDLAAVLEARQSPEWETSTADEANFVGPTRSAYFVSEERQILPYLPSIGA